MSFRRSRRRTPAFLAANCANAQKLPVRASLRAPAGRRRPKPPKPTWLKRNRISRMSQISPPPNPLQPNSLLSVGCIEKRPVFRKKIVAGTILRCCSRSKGLAAPSKATEPIQSKVSGINELDQKCHAPNPLGLTLAFTMAYAGKRAVLWQKDGSEGPLSCFGDLGAGPVPAPSRRLSQLGGLKPAPTSPSRLACPAPRVYPRLVERRPLFVVRCQSSRLDAWLRSVVRSMGTGVPISLED